jgi:hypothetical protein
VIGVALDAGSKVGGALIDKAVDSFKDHEAEERKRKEAIEKQEKALRDQFVKQMEEIETSHRYTTPYQREKAKLGYIALNSQLTALMRFGAEMEVQQEKQRREERDRLLSFGGIATTVAGSAMNSPTMLMKQADQLSKSPDFRRNIAQASSGKSPVGNPLSSAIEGAQALNKIEAAQTQMQTEVERQLKPVMSVLSKASEESTEKLVEEVEKKGKAPSDFFVVDYGKPIYVEFVGNDPATNQVRELLVEQGFQMADSKENAVGYYRIEGEYLIAESRERYESAVPIADALLIPESIKEPKEKDKGIANGLLVGAFSLLGANKAAPKPVEYRQSVLLVASRQAADSKEYRISVNRKLEAKELKPKTLAEESVDALLGKLGLFEDRSGADRASVR